MASFDLETDVIVCEKASHKHDLFSHRKDEKLSWPRMKTLSTSNSCPGSKKRRKWADGMHILLCW